MWEPGLFQSTSVIADGRISVLLDVEALGYQCFNPRPSLLTDESKRPISRRLAVAGRFNPRPSLLTDESERARRSP